MRIRTAVMPGFGWFLTIVIGALAGWIAEKITRSSMGIIANIVMGIIGALIGGFIATRLGYEYGGFWGNLLVATLGAVIVILVFRALRGRA